MRREIQRDIRAKERAIETLSAKYCREPRLPQETVRQALYSIGDNHAFLRTNRDPCDRMIGYLQKYFHPTQVRDKKGADSLAIRSGRGGSRLSHDHARQYALRSGVKFCMVRICFSIPQESFTRSDHQTCSTSGRSLSRTCSQKLSRIVYATLARV